MSVVNSFSEEDDNYIRRHVGSNAKEIEQMLHDCGCDTLGDLLQKVIPQSIFDPSATALHHTASERRALSDLRKVAAKNSVLVSMLGQGYYGTLTPKVILRNLLENPAWYTAYTPYQAEISQGRLEALLNFQQLTIDLTGMDIAGASLLDEATAAAEAMSMMHRLDKGKKNTIFVDNKCHTQVIDVIKNTGLCYWY